MRRPVGVRTDLMVPVCPTTAGVEAGDPVRGQCVGGLAEQLRGLAPAGAEDQCGVVPGDSGLFRDGGGGLAGQGKGIVV